MGNLGLKNSEEEGPEKASTVTEKESIGERERKHQLGNGNESGKGQNSFEIVREMK